jgi:hypothetical protein
MTTTTIGKMAELDSTLFNFKGTGVAGTAAAGVSTSIDYKLTEDRLCLGAFIVLKGHVILDNVDFQVVDVDGIMAPAGTVLKQFIYSWYVVEDQQYQPEKHIPYPAKIFQGLYIRCIYNSVGTVPVTVCINYDLHKVLA